MSDKGKALVGKKIAELVHDGQVIGVGTGSTVAAALDAISERVKKDKLNVKFVPTSYQSTWQLEQLGLSALDFVGDRKIDWSFDGADAVVAVFAMDDADSYAWTFSTEEDGIIEQALSAISDCEDIKLFVIGTKSDNDHAVDEAEAWEKCAGIEDVDCSFYLASAKDDVGVSEAFEALTAALMEG